MGDKIVRIEFKKTGPLIYISHLDLQRTFGRIFRRSNIPVRYSEGFNPHMRMVFALTVSVGTESLCELCDLYIDENADVTVQDVEKMLLPNMPAGLELISCRLPDFPFSAIKFADYDITLDTDAAAEDIKTFLSDKVEVLKRSKSGEKIVNISPMIKELYLEETEDHQKIIHTRLSSSQDEYLNPEYIVKALSERYMIKNYFITRKALIVDKNR